ncbi:MAG TPA: NirA family protein, partial [Planctomycetota bacterium]|nr:NirA family protein [Planctomycetota bacterium]
TAPPTAGIDPIELLDTFPLARSLHHHILERRELYGLPRKFNIAFDGGGSTGALEDTNDIGFSARRHAATGRVGFRMALGGITGHGDFAEDSGVFLDPSECIDVAAAVLGVYIREGDRTDRRRARFKHVLDRYGIDAFLRRVEEALGRELPRARLDECEPRPPLVARAHIGIHAQRQNGRFWLGFVPPAGRMPAAAMRTLARLATTRGEGALRLTVWQNAILAGVREDDVERLRMEVEAIGFPTDPTAFGAGVVACTGNRGCKYAATDTKAHALRVVRELEERMSLREPINMHFTGCPHSCAQHFIGDIGLLGTTIESGDDLLEGYRVYVGGGFGGERRIAREVDAGVPASDLPVRLEGMLRAYLDRRRDAEESFSSFCARLDDAELRRVFACGSPSVSAGA